MIQQLILNTLIACHPKVASAVTPAIPSDTEKATETKPSALELKETFTDVYIEPPWPSSLPEPVGLDTLPEIRPSSEVLGQYSSPIFLSDLSYYDLRFYDQPEDKPYEFVCERLCDYTPDDPNRGTVHLTNVRNCHMNLIANWKEVVGAVQEQGRDELLPQLGVKVGVVSCNGDIGRIMHGRAATIPAQYQELDDDWGGYFARLAQEEATAVFAFGELLEHLQDWEAPAFLQDWCGRIIEEEKVHTLMMSGLAHRNGQESAVVQFPEPNRVSMKEMAIHNAITGCIGETWSAVKLCHQAEHACKYNGVFKRIAKDETSHAEFSWELHEWLMSQLTENEQEEVVQAMREMLLTVPESKSIGRMSMGEMNPENIERAWKVFSNQIETILG